MAVEDEVVHVEDTATEDASFAQEFGVATTQEVEAEATETEQPLQAETVEQEAESSDEQEGEDSQEVTEESAPKDDEREKLLALLNEIPNHNAATEKEIRKLHGKFGEVNHILQELKSNSGAANVRVTKDQFKRLNEEFPEIAEMLADDLANIRLPASGSVSPESIQPFVNTEVAKIRDEMNQTMQKNLLTLQHRDWSSVVASEEFGKWKQGQSDDVQRDLDNSWDAMYLGEKIAEFKAFREKTNNMQQKRNTRLVNAVMPKTSPAVTRTVMSEEEAFAAQFK